MVNHKDGNRTNNTLENLEWVTPRENVIHSFKFGERKKCKQVPRNTILTDFQIQQIDILRAIYTVNQMAKLFNIKYQSLKNIIHKKKQCERLIISSQAYIIVYMKVQRLSLMGVSSKYC